MRQPEHSDILANAAQLIVDENDYFTRADLREMTGISNRQIGIWLRHSLQSSYARCLNPGAPSEERQYEYGLSDRIKSRTDDEVLAIADRRQQWEFLGQVEPITAWSVRQPNNKYDPEHAQKTYIEICRFYDLYGKPMFGTTYGMALQS